MYNGKELAEEFYNFFSPHFLKLLSGISDPREQDNINLKYTLNSYLSIIILGIIQGATSMRQIVLLSQDEEIQKQLSFLFEEKGSARSQNAYTNLTEQLDTEEFQSNYNEILKDLKASGALSQFEVNGLLVSALDGIELHNHLYADRENVHECDYCLNRCHNKGTDKEREEYFHRTAVLSLVGSPGSLFLEQESMYKSEDGSDKGGEKKAAIRLLERMNNNGMMELLDVIVVDALYADAEFITYVKSIGKIPVVRIKQENYNIMKEVSELNSHIDFSQWNYDNERKVDYRYRVFENLNSWKNYKGELFIVEIEEKGKDRTIKKSKWVIPQEYIDQLFPELIREIGHLRWQEELNEFKLGNQNLNIKHMIHHDQNSIQIFTFLKFVVLSFFSLFLLSRINKKGVKKKIFLLKI